MTSVNHVNGVSDSINGSSDTLKLLICDANTQFDAELLKFETTEHFVEILRRSLPSADWTILPQPQNPNRIYLLRFEESICLEKKNFEFNLYATINLTKTSDSIDVKTSFSTYSRLVKFSKYLDWLLTDGVETAGLVSQLGVLLKIPMTEKRKELRRIRYPNVWNAVPQEPPPTYEDKILHGSWNHPGAPCIRWKRM